ncbi:hypothetical protein AC1031_005924 [Aphanomyces cochlioides]|nr:hypothetical protein AC1031_005924 [Aphanomyces cochlioides]
MSCNIGLTMTQMGWKPRFITFQLLAAMSDLLLPVPDDFSNLPKLSPADVERYRTFGHHAAAELLEFAKLDGGRINWTLRSTNSTMTLYESIEDKMPIYLVTSEFQATLEDAMAVLQTTTVAATRQILAQFQPVVLDKVRLYNLTLPTAENSYLYQSLNWHVIDTPGRGRFIKRRDMSTIEHQQMIQIDGRRAFIQSLRLVKIPGVPDLEDDYSIVRGELLHTGVLFIESNRPGVLEHMSLHHGRPNGNGNGKIGKYIIRKSAEGFYQGIVDLTSVIRAHQ